MNKSLIKYAFALLLVAAAACVLFCGRSIPAAEAPAQLSLVQNCDNGASLSVFERVDPVGAVRYDCLYPFKCKAWHDYLTGMVSFSPAAVFSWPVYLCRHDGAGYYAFSFDNTGGINSYSVSSDVCGLIAALLTVLTLFISASTGRKKPLQCLFSFVAIFSALICVLAALSYAWLPSLSMISCLCIYGYFALPFIVFLALSRMSGRCKAVWVWCSGLAFAILYYLAARGFGYLYYDVTWLLLSTMPSIIVFIPRYQWIAYAVSWILICVCAFSGITDALDSIQSTGRIFLLMSIIFSTAIKSAQVLGTRKENN